MRTLPQNIEAEQSLLGSVLVKEKVLADLAGKVAPEDFYRPEHQLTFRTMLAMQAEGTAIDIVTLTDCLNKDGLLDRVGGVRFVSHIANMVPTAANAGHYAKIVLEKAKLRRIIEAGTAVVSAAYEDCDDIAEIVDRAEQTILQATQDGLGGHERTMQEQLMELYELVNKANQTEGNMTGLSTGLRALDCLTSGLQKSDLIIVAARPGMGKTALGLNIASHAALHEGKSVTVFSLEMPPSQLIGRIICAEGNIDSLSMRNGKLTDVEWSSFIRLTEQLNASHLHIDDTPNITVAQLKQKTRRYLVEDGQLDLIVIDYLQLMSSGRSNSKENRQQEVSEISRSLKALARELNVPIIALSQLSRNVESRPDKMPMLSDLRDSGSIEQDADLVMLLYREDYYEPDTDRPGVTQVLLAKHRNGPTGIAELFFHKQLTRFVDIDRG